MPDEKDSGRRRFLNIFLGGTSVVFLGAIIYPVVKFLIPPKSDGGGAVQAVNAGSVDEFKNNSSRIVKFGNRPALVIRTAQGDFRAFIALCTHLDCTVQYLPEDGIIWCACHNGKYNLQGKNIAGPPPKPLPELAVNVQEGSVFISEEA